MPVRSLGGLSVEVGALTFDSSYYLSPYTIHRSGYDILANTVL